MSDSVLVREVVRAVARRPGLWPTAVRQAVRSVPRRWWRRWPFVPVPPAGYVGFRMVTQYGDESHRPDPDHLIRYLSWCREWDRFRRHHPGVGAAESAR